MKHRWAALGFVLALGAIMPRMASSQASLPRPAGERSTATGFELRQNYPNPFNPTTTIPFVIGDYPTCSDRGTHRVTLQIFNVLAQLVATPILQGGDVAAGQPLVNIPLRCGTYTAFWNGNYRDTQQEAASGIYAFRLQVDGKVAVIKGVVTK